MFRDLEPVEFSVTDTDTVVAVNRVTRMSVAGEILSGGDMALDGGVRNEMSTIAAGGDLRIAGGAAAVENIAWQPTAEISHGTDLDVFGYKNKKHNFNRDWVRDRWLEGPDATFTQATVAVPAAGYEYVTIDTGPVVAATMTAGHALVIDAGRITNTSVHGGGGLGAMGGAPLSGPGSTALGTARRATATAPSTGAPGAAAEGAGGPAAAAMQVVGTAERPLPGLVPEDNGMFDLASDPDAPFLVTTARRLWGRG